MRFAASRADLSRAAFQKAKRSESCKLRARFVLLVIIPNWLEVGVKFGAERFG